MAEGYNHINNGESGLSVRNKLNAFYGRYIIPEPLITIRFDDCFSHTYDGWFPLLQSKGVVGVECFVTHEVGLPNFMTWAQIKMLQDAGWEITLHSDYDAGWILYNAAQIEAAITEGLAAASANGINVKNLVPHRYGQTNPLVRKIARQYFRSCGVGHTMGLINGVNPPSIDPYNWCAIRCDIGGDYQYENPADVANIKLLIDEAYDNNTWLQMFSHDYTVAKAAGLADIIDYGLAKGIRFVTIDQALDVFYPYISGGDNFSVSENAVRIDRTYGRAFQLDENKCKIGFDGGLQNEEEDNTFIGKYAGERSTGKWRTDIGSEAGYEATPNSQVNIGYQSGYKSTGANAISIGKGAGKYLTATEGIAIGNDAGQNATGYNMTAIGARAGKTNTGNRGVFIGADCGNGNIGAYAIGIGVEACKNNTKGYFVEIRNQYANAIAWIKGFLNTRAFIQGSPAVAVDDAEIPNSSLHFYLDEAGNKLKVRVRYSDGTYKDGEIALI